MNPYQLLQSLQMTDGFFPTGAFSFSDGLETTAQEGSLTDGAALEDWLKHYVQSVFIPLDGRALRWTIESHRRSDWSRLEELDQELTALRPASESRAGSVSLGNRLLKNCVQLYPGRGLEDLENRVAVGSMHGNVALVHGVVFQTLGFTTEEALICFAYSRLSATASAALRLAPLGQQEVQGVLGRVLDTVPAAVEAILEEEERELMSFVPLMDIYQIEHRYLYSRMFRS